MFFVLLSLLLGGVPLDVGVVSTQTMPSGTKEICMFKDELPGKYCYWCGQENEGGRTTCKRCGRAI